MSSFPAEMSASIVPESNLMELSVTADSPETGISDTAVGAEELHNHFRLYYSECSIGDTAAAAGFRQCRRIGFRRKSTPRRHFWRQRLVRRR